MSQIVSIVVESNRVGFYKILKDTDPIKFGGIQFGYRLCRSHSRKGKSHQFNEDRYN